MYKILMKAGITIMRVGLKSTDLVTNEADLGHGYHPAFRQLVEGEICKEQMQQLSNERWFSPMIGHKAANKKYFESKYPLLSFSYKQDPTLKDGIIMKK